MERCEWCGFLVLVANANLDEPQLCSSCTSAVQVQITLTRAAKAE